MPKVRYQRGGAPGPIYLITVLCFMTGLSDEQKANFTLMKEIVDELQAWNLEVFQGSDAVQSQDLGTREDSLVGVK